MKNRRDCSFTLCKNFIKEAFNKYDTIRNVNFEIIDILDNCIKTKITINGKNRVFDILLDKKKKEVKLKSKNNLKNQAMKIYDETSDCLENLNNEDKRNEVILIEEKQKEDDVIFENNLNDFNSKIENSINEKTDMNNEEKNTVPPKIEDFKNIHHVTHEVNDSKDKYNIILDENNKSDKLFIENKKNGENISYVNSDDSEYDDEEPENEYDHNDPYYKKYPEVFKCYDCYETNVDKEELFDIAQEYIDKYNLVNNENKKLKNDNENFKNEIKNKDKKLDTYIKEYNNLLKINNELKESIKNSELDIEFITELNNKFMELFLINHKSFDYIVNIILTIEKTNPKKVHEIINKNINKYRNDIQAIANEAEDIRKSFLKLNTDKFGDKLNTKD